MPQSLAGRDAAAQQTARTPLTGLFLSTTEWHGGSVRRVPGDGPDGNLVGKGLSALALC